MDKLGGPIYCGIKFTDECKLSDKIKRKIIDNYKGMPKYLAHCIMNYDDFMSKPFDLEYIKSHCKIVVENFCINCSYPHRIFVVKRNIIESLKDELSKRREHLTVVDSQHNYYLLGVHAARGGPIYDTTYGDPPMDEEIEIIIVK